MVPGETLAGRYEIVRELGRGGAGVTCLARDTASGAKDVVVKILHLGLMGDWKTAELFEREAAVLKELRHDRIPAYLDFLKIDLEGTARYALVREFVDGESLQARVEAGWRATEEQIRGIGARLARIVAYIHDVRPAVIHRDINPRNVIMRGDGEIFLVDFGGVQDAVGSSTGTGPTVVGTPGYAPMEQFVGRATVRSDRYALAATLLFLLTHKNPADLPVRDMKVDLPAVMELSSRELARVLDNWLEPDQARRTLGETEAVALLEGTAQAPAVEPRRPPPYGSRITRREDAGTVCFLVPERQSGTGVPAIGLFGIFWLAFVGIWTYTAIRLKAPPFFPLFSLPFWAVGIGLISRTLLALFGRREIQISGNTLAYTRRMLFCSRRRTVPLADVGECAIVEGGRLSLDVGARTLRFGEGLSAREREWLRDAINADLRALARALTGLCAPAIMQRSKEKR